jgi:hypothetical protein
MKEGRYVISKWELTVPCFALEQMSYKWEEIHQIRNSGDWMRLTKTMGSHFNITACRTVNKMKSPLFKHWDWMRCISVLFYWFTREAI